MVLLAIRYTMIVVIILHWVSCLNYFVPHLRVLIYGRKHKHSWQSIHSSLSKYRPYDQIIRTTLTRYQTSFFRTAGYMLAARSATPDDFVELAKKARGNSQVPVESIVFDFPLEELFMDMFSMILGKILTSTFAVVIISRIFELYTLETKYQAIMNQLNEFMKNKKLPLAMRDRLIKYYEHRYQKKYFKEGVITEILSENLRKEVNINVCRQLVHMVNIFSELPPHILSDVLAHLKAEVYLPNDIIIKSGTVGDCMYFLASGTVSVYTPSGREVCHLQDGAYFGEISLILKNTKRTTDIIAIEMCEVFRLDKKAFRSCFKYDRYGVFEKMQQIAEQRLQQTALLEESYKLELFQKAYTEKL